MLNTTALAVLAYSLLSVAHGRATIYWPKDGNCGSRKADGTVFTRSDAHIAHRSLPIGTKGILCNLRTKRCVETEVRDRGPWGSLRSCKEGKPVPYRVRGKSFSAKKIRWLGRCVYWQAQPGRIIEGFTRRGEFDITRPVAKAIGHRQFDRAMFIYQRRRGGSWRKVSEKLIPIVFQPCSS